MRDFTVQKFVSLCLAFQSKDYEFITFTDYCLNNRPRRFIIMRHDVDRIPSAALYIAQFESDLHIRASFYFRSTRESYNESIIRKLANMGHEIGYHYEDLSLARGDTIQAIESFKKNLTKLRCLYPIRTICMHGSPLSKLDNRLLWERYDYQEFGIIGEPYFDIDFNSVLYLTDTGRCWNGAAVSVRDKVATNFNYCMKSTNQIIKALYANLLPDKIMINIHPHRWNDKLLPWFKEFVWQNTKNVAKRIKVRLES